MNIYLCFSNLHALQACFISQTKRGVCFYTSSVSKDLLKKDFNGLIIPIREMTGGLFPSLLFLFCKKRSRSVNIFTGCKNQYYTGFFSSVYPRHHLYLIDDGLSMYELHNKKAVKGKRFLKKLISLFLRKLGVVYFHEEHLATLDREGYRVLMFPEVFDQEDKAETLSLNQFGDFSRFMDRMTAKGASNNSFGKKTYVASYQESLNKESNLGGLGSNYDVYWHPRVIARKNNYPLEILLFSSRTIHIGFSSLFIFFVFAKFPGEIVVSSDIRDSDFYKRLAARVRWVEGLNIKVADRHQKVES